MPDSHMAIDTDSELFRFVRATDQRAFEKNVLPTLKGTGWVQRWDTIRESLFGKYNGKSEQSLTGFREHKLNDYPDPKLVSELYQPALARMTDDIESSLTSSQEGKSDKGFRLAVVNYVLGILMHPAADGNGQSFRELALSYIQEHCPEFKDTYFPIKYTSNPAETKIHGWDDAEFHKLKIGFPKEMSEGDLKLLQFFQEACKIDLKVMREANRVTEHNLGEWMTTRKNELVADIMQKMGVTMQEVMPKGSYLPTVALARYISNILKNRYPGYVFEMYPQKADEKTYILTTALTTPGGLEAMQSYVETGTTGINADALDIEQRAINTLNKVFNQQDAEFISVLHQETSPIHEQKYQNQLHKRRM